MPLRMVVMRRPEPVLIAVALLVTVGVAHRAPLGIYGIGVVNGSALALAALGVTLVYRSSRVVNVAHLALAVLSSTVFASGVTYEPLIRWARALCGGGCLRHPSAWVRDVDYALCASLAVAVAVLLSWLTYLFVIRPLEPAPRLLGTVATIFLVSVWGVLAGKVPGLLSTRAQKEAEVAVGAPAPPFGWSLHVGGVRFSSAAILTVIVVATAAPALAALLRWTATGVAIRASADAPEAMAAVGIDVRRVTGRVWAIAGALAGIGGVLTTMGSAPLPAGASVDAPVLARVLAAAVVARFVSLPIAALAAVVLGVVDAAIGYTSGSTQPVDVVIVVALAAVLLVQRASSTRLELATAGAWRTAAETRPIPSVLRRLPQVRNGIRAAGTFLVLVVVGAPWVLSPAQTSLASYALVVTLVFLSLLVLTGWAGQISLGQMAFAAAGAWVVAVTHLPALVAVPVAMLAAATLAVLVGLPALRLRGLQLAIVTLVVNLSVSTYLLSDRYLGSALPARVGRPRGFGLRLDDERTFFYVVLLVVALGYAAVLGLRRSALARELLATRDNETAAQAFGVAPVRARLSAFAIAGALAGLAGALLAYQQHSVLVDSFSPDRSVSLFLYAVIGGFGAPAGALVAGGFYAAVTVFGWPTAVTQALTGIGGLALLILSRGGLMQALAGWRDSWLRSVARRHRLSVRSLGTDASDAATRRLAIAPKVRTGGATVFVVPRYRVDGQYGMTPPPPTDVSHG